MVEEEIGRKAKVSYVAASDGGLWGSESDGDPDAQPESEAYGRLFCTLQTEARTRPPGNYCDKMHRTKEAQLIAQHCDGRDVDLVYASQHSSLDVENPIANDLKKFSDRKQALEPEDDDPRGYNSDAISQF